MSDKLIGIKPKTTTRKIYRTTSEDVKIEFYNQLHVDVRIEFYNPRGYNTKYLNTVFDKSTTITREHIILNLISKRYSTKDYNNDKPLIFVTTNTPLTRHFNSTKYSNQLRSYRETPFVNYSSPNTKAPINPSQHMNVQRIEKIN